jgi:hypothetical protein
MPVRAEEPVAPSVAPEAARRTATEWMAEGYIRKAENDLPGAQAAFEEAGKAGFDAQRVDMELAYVAVQRGDAAAARARFQGALGGRDPKLAARAREELAQSWLAEAYARKEKGALAGAHLAFEEALAAGASPQRTEMELGYVALAEKNLDQADRSFARAAGGPDAELATRARAELDQLPRHFWADLYVEVYAWDRISGPIPISDAVPTVRARGFYRPSLDLDFHFYFFAQVTRDSASTWAGGAAVPLIYADNAAMFGPGMLLRLWERRVGLFVQGGPAINLLHGGVSLDIRAGAFLGLETSRCWPSAVSGATFDFIPCADLYTEADYFSRFENNVAGFARGRAGASWLVTGPVAWQVIVEGRGGLDSNRNYYNNFVEAGIGPRWRLVSPFRLDLFASFEVGTYLGIAGKDPAPTHLFYTDLRLVASTYLEF